jgi:hypothetical protein
LWVWGVGGGVCGGWWGGGGGGRGRGPPPRRLGRRFFRTCGGLSACLPSCTLWSCLSVRSSVRPSIRVSVCPSSLFIPSINHNISHAGRPLAIMEIQLLLCVLCQRYDFKPSKPFTDKMKVTIVASSADGIPVVLTRRQR